MELIACASGMDLAFGGNQHVDPLVGQGLRQFRAYRVTNS